MGKSPLVSGINIDGKLIRDTLGGIGDVAMRMRQAVTGEITPEKKSELIELSLEMQDRINAGQTETNKIEAANSRLFVSGWRPFIGWVCGVSLGLYYVPQFLLAAVLWVVSSLQTGAVTQYPIADIDGLMELVIGLLGMAGWRSLEKIKGVAR